MDKFHIVAMNNEKCVRFHHIKRIMDQVSRQFFKEKGLHLKGYFLTRDFSPIIYNSTMAFAKSFVT